MKKLNYLLLILGGIVAVYDVYGLLLNELSNWEHWVLSALVVLLISIAVKPKRDSIIKSRDEENYSAKSSSLNRQQRRALKRLSSKERKEIDRFVGEKIKQQNIWEDNK
jgi:hypothetical protein